MKRFCLRQYILNNNYYLKVRFAKLYSNLNATIGISCTARAHVVVTT